MRFELQESRNELVDDPSQEVFKVRNGHRDMRVLQ